MALSPLTSDLGFESWDWKKFQLGDLYPFNRSTVGSGWISRISDNMVWIPVVQSKQKKNKSTKMSTHNFFLIIIWKCCDLTQHGTNTWFQDATGFLVASYKPRHFPRCALRIFHDPVILIFFRTIISHNYFAMICSRRIHVTVGTIIDYLLKTYGKKRKEKKEEKYVMHWCSCPIFWIM